MANTRFTDEAIAPLRFPDEKKIICRDCMLREKDRQMGNSRISGATLGMCDAFGNKPTFILFENETCPYYIKDD